MSQTEKGLRDWAALALETKDPHVRQMAVSNLLQVAIARSRLVEEMRAQEIASRRPILLPYVVDAE